MTHKIASLFKGREESRALTLIVRIPKGIGHAVLELNPSIWNMNFRQVWCQSGIERTLYDTVWPFTKIISIPRKLKMYYMSMVRRFKNVLYEYHGVTLHHFWALWPKRYLYNRSLKSCLCLEDWKCTIGVPWCQLSTAPRLCSLSELLCGTYVCHSVGDVSRWVSKVNSFEMLAHVAVSLIIFKLCVL